MPQNTNLNVTPYFDDFDEEKKFNRVLFKAGIPIQSRELTTLQSILQNQIEKFGKHFFKEGSVVIPGSLVYDNEYTAVKIESSFFGVPVDLYKDKLVGLKIRGKTSGIKATVVGYLSAEQSLQNATTLYIKYESSSSEDNAGQAFLDGENLVTIAGFEFGNTVFTPDSDFATCIATNSAATGSAFSITSGVWFARGAFIDVQAETIILDQYSTKPSYRVGFNVTEEIISAVDDESLYDNASGFSNYTSPGADRLKISLHLVKKDLNDYLDDSFIELLRVDDGVLEKVVEKTVYSEIATELARRTYDESGNYYVDEFSVSAKESINNRFDTFGVFFEDNLTKSGNTPSKDLYALEIGPGKAYVQGYEIETVGNTFVDVAKPRTTETIESSSVPFQAGNLVVVNNAFGAASVGIATTGWVDLRDERLGATKSTASGQSIGRARVYDYKASAAAYADDASTFDLYLFDIQTDTQLVLNQELTISAPALIEGARSGARGFLRSQSGTTLTLNQTSGQFLRDETILVNGISNGRVITSISEFSIDDVKAFRQQNGTQIFSADAVLTPRINFGGQSFTITSSTAVSKTGWTKDLKVGDILQYQNDGDVYNRITAINADNKTVSIEQVEDVTGVADGDVPTSTIEVSGVSVVSAKVKGSRSGYLFSEMPDVGIESIDLTTSDIFVRKETRGASTDGDGVLDLPSLAGTDFVYTPFDEERYTVTYNDGSIETLTSDQLSITSGGKTGSISGLTQSETNVVVITTQQKSKVTSKSKVLSRCSLITVDGSKNEYSGISTANQDGLTYKTGYGLRVQDKEISLNVADAIGVHAVFESSTSGVPTLPSLTLSSLNGPNASTTDLQVGEVLIGSESGAAAVIVEKSTPSKITIVSKNENSFKKDEEVKFQDSGVLGNVSDIDAGDKNIAKNFVFDNGQRPEYYDFSRLVRKKGAPVPSKQLTIVFDKLTINAEDSGELVTVNSYSGTEYDRIPKIGDISNSDIIDIRPRVADFSGSLSPFEFESRDFGGSGQSTPSVLVSDENLTFDYKYYLGRIDSLYLTKTGNFTVVEGTPAKFPSEPSKIADAFELAKITYSPYVFDLQKDLKIEFRANKRYTMKDIGKLENRIENLEYYTSLSLLESKTESLLIQDPDTGLDRFKSGFVVDNFNTKDVADPEDAEFDIANGVMMAPRYFDSIDLQIGSESLVGLNGDPDPNIDTLFAEDLGSTNVKKTLDCVTLDYEEVIQREQPFASRVENVNPYTVYDWFGTLLLTPEQDVFVERESENFGGFYGVSNTSFSFNTQANITNMREQNIMLDAFMLKPTTRHYTFFADTDMSIERSLVVPKLLEVTPTQGSFQVGETIIGTQQGVTNNNSVRTLRFRLCSANHKSGPFNNPSDTYSTNPYTNTALGSEYSSTSTTLNVDLVSLVDKSNENFFGAAIEGMTLVGETTGAEATINSVRLVSDNLGRLQSSVFIPSGEPAFRNGKNNIVLTSASGNDIPGLKVSSANATFYSNGTTITEITIQQETPPPPPPPPPPPAPVIINNTTVIDRTVTVTNTIIQEVEVEEEDDPLAQSFFVEEKNGCFITSIDLFFATKSETMPLEIRLVPVINGTPSKNFHAHSVVHKNPEDVNISLDATVPTTFTFPRPVYLENGEHAVVVIADTSDYNQWISRIGDVDIATANLDLSQQVRITKQPTLGSLYKGQNAGTWTPSQLEDMKYVLRKAKFVTEPGAFRFYNPELNTFNTRNKLNSNPIEVYSKKVTLGLSSALSGYEEQIVIGSEIRQDNTTATGFVEAQLGPVAIGGTGLTVTDSGSDYEDGTNVAITFSTLTGEGNGVTGTCTVTSGSIASVNIINTGKGFAVGDTLTGTVGTKGLGRDLLFTVGVVTSFNTLKLTACNGVDFNTSNQIQFVPTQGDGAGIGSTVFGINPTSLDVNAKEFDGRHFRVNHANHSMHAANNRVVIKGVEGDTIPTKITVGYGVSSIENISVGNSSNFNFFEGSQVTANNPGFAIMGNEIIAYTGVGNNVLTGITTRGIDGTIPKTYAVNHPIQKYETAGVSLRKVNTEHTFADVTNNITDKITLDSYVLNIAGDKFFDKDESVGGENVSASQNIQYDSIVPNIDYRAVDGTAINAQVRTISATSIDNTEVSFVDQGFESVSLEGETRFSSPRMIASKVNETNSLSSLPGSKSFTIEMTMETTDENLSPVVDVFDSNITTRSNRINNPIENYLTDSRTRTDEDPQSFTYVTNPVNLDNPATSLKCLVGAHRPSDCTIRAYYRLKRVDGSDSKVYEPFPGYDNLDASDKVIDSKNNSGLPDRNISASTSNVFTEYEWTIDKLPQFTSFQVKLVVTSTNQAVTAQMIDFRTIAVA